MRETRVDRITNKANLPRFRAKNEGAVKNKANSAGRDPAKSEIRDAIREIRVNRVDKMTNKPNSGRDGIGVTLFEIAIYVNLAVCRIGRPAPTSTVPGQ
jgi:hypothetical protein